jgi:hypothetical protein
MTVAQWSTTAALNVLSSGTSGTGGVNIDEGMSPSGVNNAMRDIMAQIATFITAGSFTGTNFTITSTDADAGLGPILILDRNSATPAASDFIGQIIFRGRDSGAASENYADIIAQINDTTAASEDATVSFRTKIAGAQTAVMTISSAGLTVSTGLILPQAAAPAPTAEGDMRWDTDDNRIVVGDGAAAKTFFNCESGTYTPTLFNTTNVAASTASVCQYIRVGNIVWVSGNVQIDPTAAGPTITVMGMSLPIASDLASVIQLAGTANGYGFAGAETYAIIGDAANNRATFNGAAVTTAAHDHAFMFMYQIL